MRFIFIIYIYLMELSNRGDSLHWYYIWIIINTYNIYRSLSAHSTTPHGYKLRSHSLSWNIRSNCLFLFRSRSVKKPQSWQKEEVLVFACADSSSLSNLWGHLLYSVAYAFLDHILKYKVHILLFFV